MPDSAPIPSSRPAGQLVVKGARTHNLKGVDLTLPHRQLVVFTGVSGSGKSSLAFDTIYAEGQRRYVESLSAYARQFLERMEKPDVDANEGIAPAMATVRRELSPIERNLEATRVAYGLDEVELQPFEVRNDLDAQQVAGIGIAARCREEALDDHRADSPRTAGDERNAAVEREDVIEIHAASPLSGARVTRQVQ